MFEKASGSTRRSGRKKRKAKKSIRKKQRPMKIKMFLMRFAGTKLTTIIIRTTLMPAEIIERIKMTKTILP